MGKVGWKFVKLSDICSYETSKIPVSELNTENYISTENMLADRGGVTSASSLPNVEYATRFLKNQTLLSNIRPYFKKLWIANKEGGCSNDILCFKMNSDIDPLFFYYQLSQDSFFDFVMAGSKGTKMPRGDKQHIMQFDFSLPSFEKQKKIAKILSSLDDKIELNNQINANLEQQAQAIFKSWFIDFEPFKDGEFIESELGLFPKGWKVGKLNDGIEIKYGKDHKLLKDGAIPVYGSGGIMRYVNSSLYDKESILIPRKGTLSNLYYITDPFWTVDTMFYSKIRNEISGKYIYLCLKNMDLASMNVGSAVPSLTTEVLNNITILYPDEKVLTRFNIFVSSLFTSLRFNDIENKNLVMLRNTLLPKLMSGEFEV